MDHREEMYQTADKYFMDIIIPYAPVNREAMQLVKKFRPFRKKDYGIYIEKYRELGEAAEQISMEHIAIPAEDKEAAQLKEAFDNSRKSFSLLCKRNLKFIEFQSKKSNGGEVSVEEFKELSMGLTAILNTAGQDMDRLEQIYRDMRGISAQEEQTTV